VCYAEPVRHLRVVELEWGAFDDLVVTAKRARAGAQIVHGAQHSDAPATTSLRARPDSTRDIADRTVTNVGKIQTANALVVQSHGTNAAWPKVAVMTWSSTPPALSPAVFERVSSTVAFVEPLALPR